MKGRGERKERGGSRLQRKENKSREGRMKVPAVIRNQM